MTPAMLSLLILLIGTPTLTLLAYLIPASYTFRPNKLMECYPQASVMGLERSKTHRLAYAPYLFYQMPTGAVAYYEDYLFLHDGTNTKVFLVPESIHERLFQTIVAWHEADYEEVLKAIQPLRLKEIKRYSIRFLLHHKILSMILNDTRDKVIAAFYSQQRVMRQEIFTSKMLDLKQQVEAGEITKEEAFQILNGSDR